MGHGSYNASDWVKLKHSRGIKETSNVSAIFRQKQMDDRFDPKYIQMRESCDSEDSPEATPVIIGFDVTGSMGYLAEEIAKNALNKTILNIYDKKPVTNPHIMCAAIGDVSDRAPLQVTQFEADVRVFEQVMDLWLEGAGGDGPEDYNLLWYFADRHTRTDAYDKRKKKGFLFTIGDASVHGGLSGEKIEHIFGDSIEMMILNAELLSKVSEKYEVFHIVTKNTNSLKSWATVLPGRVAYIDANNIKYLSEVITSIMQVVNGTTHEDAVAQWPEEARPAVKKALDTICLIKNISKAVMQYKIESLIRKILSK